MGRLQDTATTLLLVLLAGVYLAASLAPAVVALRRKNPSPAEHPAHPQHPAPQQQQQHHHHPEHPASQRGI